MKHSLIGLVLLLVGMSAASAGGTPESFTRDYRGLSSVEISAEMMDVEISAIAGNTISVRVDSIPPGVTVSDRVRRRGVALHVQGRPSWFDRDEVRAHMTVGVPNGISLDITTSSGSITVQGVQGRQTLRSASGRVVLEEPGGEIVVRSASGPVTARDIVGTIAVQTASGVVSLERCRGIITVETASGSISGEGVQLTADAAFRTASGSIRVDLDNALEDLRYVLTTSSGRLRFGNVSGGNHLAGGSGRFLIEGRSASGSQEYF
ncbi:MAG: DUF4097 family beta strand repeat-containing protein [Alkalispirochaeta sp.]